MYWNTYNRYKQQNTDLRVNLQFVKNAYNGQNQPYIQNSQNPVTAEHMGSPPSPPQTCP